MQITVLDGYTMGNTDNPWTPLEELGTLKVYDRTAPEDVIKRSADADILVVNKIIMSEQIIKQLPNLKCIAVSATGYNTIDLKVAKNAGITVCNVPAYSTQSVAQFTFALILELASQVGQHDRAVKSGEWIDCPDFCFWKNSLTELAGKTLGIVGFGNIGQAVGKLGNAFGMNILAYTPRPKKAPDYTPFAFTDFTTLIKTADIISLHCPLTPENTELFNQEIFGLMKSNAFLINTARGPLIDEKALYSALTNKNIGGAALDVLTIEPPAADNPLYQAPNLIITPHIAWATLESRTRLMQTCAENIKAFLDGTPQNVVTI